ncbi:response regulator [Sulfurimonas sp. MAG313]|nr:response regulator [Sulfurimonas sp. MAG313]MDF1881117.1 response regulator [Sulfurimonas sp. MAG313]
MKRVMVVDDSKTVRLYHGSLLKEMGYEVVEAENGMEAMEKSQDCDVDLYLVDVNMPIMDGYTFVKEIRELQCYKTTPIIMITTQAHDEDREEAFKMGANLFETKPIKPEVLKNYLLILIP